MGSCTSLCDPFKYLRTDDFYAHFAHRLDRLVNLVEAPQARQYNATGQPACQQKY